MSLNKFADLKPKPWMRINCNDIVCENMVCNGDATMGGVNTELTCHDIDAVNNAVIGGDCIINNINFKPTNSPIVGKVLGSDGMGGTIWVDNDINPGTNLMYSGTPPTIVGQLSVFNDITGGSVKQSIIMEDDIIIKNGTVAMEGDLDINGNSLNNVDELDCKRVNIDTDANPANHLYIKGYTNSPDLEIRYKATDATLKSFGVFSQTFRNGGSIGGIGLLNSRSNGTFDTPTALGSGVRIYEQYDQGHDGAGYSLGVNIITETTEPWTPGNHGAKWQIKTTNIGETQATTKLTIDDNGLALGDNLGNGGLDLNGSNINNGNNATFTGELSVPVIGSGVSTETIVRNLAVGDGGGEYFFPGTSSGTSNGDYLAINGNNLEFKSLSPPSYCETYFTENTTPTPLPVINTYVPIVGVRSNGLNSGFTPSGTLITYDRLETKVHKVDMAVSWESDGKDSETYSISIFKNGVLIPSSETRAVLDDNNKTWPRNASVSSLVSLSTNDTLEARVKNLDTTQGCVIVDFSINAIKID